MMAFFNGKNSKRKDLRKVFAFILVLALVIGLIPGAGVFALADTVEVDQTGVHNTSSSAFYLTDGAIWTDKQVEQDATSPDAFDVTLKAVGQSFQDDSVSPKLDVVFVLDVSASMTQNQSPKLANLKTAAKDATDIFLASGNDNRIAIVKYNTTASEVLIGGQNFSAATSDVKTAINDLSANNYTNIQNGLYVAKKVINARADTSRTPIIILMSDGEPNRYYNFDTNPNNTGNPTSSGASNNLADANTIWNTIKQAMNTRNNPPTGPAISIYTIGFAVTGNPRAVATLDPTDTNTAPYRPSGAGFNHKYNTKYIAVNSSTDMQEIKDAFTNLAKELTTYGPTQKVQVTPDYHDVVIGDVIGEGFELVEPLVQPDRGTVTYTTSGGVNVLTWTIPGDQLAVRPSGSTSSAISDADMNVYTFKVKLADTATGTGDNDIYYTNSRTEGDNKATFTVDPRNPAYPGGPSPQNLLNYGWLTLKEKENETPDPITLKVVKEVTGDAPDPNDYYGFVITFTQGGEPYILSEAELEGVNGPNSIWHGQRPDTNNYYFELQNGGWIEIPLPADVSYELYEDEANGAEPTYTLPDLDGVYQEEDTVYGTMGDISQTITVLNTFGGDEDPDADKLTVKKIVTGNKAPSGASFDFIATFWIDDPAPQYRTTTVLPLQTSDTLQKEQGEPQAPAQVPEGESQPGTGEGEPDSIVPSSADDRQADADSEDFGSGLFSATANDVIDAGMDPDADLPGETGGEDDPDLGNGGSGLGDDGIVGPEADGPEGEIPEDLDGTGNDETNLQLQFAAPLIEEVPTTTQVAFSFNLTGGATRVFDLDEIREMFTYYYGGPIHFEIVETPNAAATVTVTAGALGLDELATAGSSISGIIVRGNEVVNRIITYTNDFGDTTGGTTTTTTTRDRGGSTTPVVIPPEPIPEAPVPEEIILDDEIPAAPLPKTGGIPAILLFGAGALLAGGGLILRRKENNK